VQIGKDKQATKYLHELDSHLSERHQIRDIVDTTPANKLHGSLSAEALVKVLLGGVNRRVDKDKAKKQK
jgi:hypothetical protein